MRIVLLILSFGLVAEASAQEVCTTSGFLLLNSQQAVDEFQTNHGPCSVLDGSIKVEGPDIIDLSGLSELEEVSEFIVSSNPILTNLDGLEKLRKFSHLSIRDNPVLLDISAFSGISQINGSLGISQNDLLVDFSPLSDLAVIESSFAFSDSPGLTGFNAFSSLRSVGSLIVSNCDQLTNLTGLANLESIGVLVVQENAALTSLKGLESLQHIQAIRLENNPGLIRLELQIPVGSLDYLTLDNNDALMDIESLSAITSIKDGLRIEDNEALTDVSGLRNITSVGSIWVTRQIGLANLGGMQLAGEIPGLVLIGTNHGLKNLDEFSGVEKVGSLFITWNDGLESIDGFASLNSVNGDMRIWGNGKLEDLNGLTRIEIVEGDMRIGFSPIRSSLGLSSLSSVGGDVELRAHSWTELDGLVNLESVGGDLFVVGDTLQRCGGLSKLLDQIDDGEPGPGPGESGIPDIGGDVGVHGGVGCRSVKEIVSISGFQRIDSTLNGAFVNPDAPFQGMFITVYPSLELVFAAWFTFDLNTLNMPIAAQFGASDQRWVTGLGTWEGTEVLIELELTSGGKFNDFEPTAQQVSGYGEMVLKFLSCDLIEVSYLIPTLALNEKFYFERALSSSESLCDSLQD